MIIIAISLEIIEIVTFVIGILKGIWIPFFVTMAVFIVCTFFIFSYWKYIGKRGMHNGNSKCE